MTRRAQHPCLMPLPLRAEPHPGAALAASRPFEPVYAAERTPRLERALQRFAAGRGACAGPPLPLVIDCAAAGAPFPALGDDESYTLTLSAAAVHVSAAEDWGVLRALATLTQLLTGTANVAPVRIVDAPRFPWRGLMLDVARHFLPRGDLLRTLDAMAAFKLNVLHLHLSDDQGFRFPSTRFPRLASPAHYSRAELDELVAAAADRGIRVVPELDVPGHTASWLAAHPEWGSGPAQPSRRFGVHRECLDPTRAEVRDAVAALFAELAAVFPDRYLHIGGDEVHPAWWSEDDDVRAFMASHGLADPAALQARFNRELHQALEGLGRRTLGWDEVLHPALPAAVTVQAWRGATARDRALAAGHDCVLSAPYYLDLCYPADVHYGFDPAAPEAELVAREDALLEDPRLAHVAGGIAWTRQWRDDKCTHAAAVPAGRLLGAEACLWSELVDARVLDVRLWSRMPALAERFWSPAACADPDDMYRRLAVMLERLPLWAGVDVPGDARRLAAEAGVKDTWRVLVDVLEPVKWYGRLLGEDALAARLQGREMPQSRPYDADTPLNRVADALPPESLATRQLMLLCRAETAGDAGARAALQAIAEAWVALPPGGGPAELERPAEILRELGAIVLDVLAGSLDGAAARQSLATAGRPVGEYLLAPAPVLAAWVTARQAAAAGAQND